ncbi:MAG: hypothetical protein KF760_30865 [Candidatus Eremiobacteraeota bacterium]|nr:hypothetical protein [Candidatus Eremiobacteraeota bacterium]MCW5872323.1 hypothetical protein [Candidatus Eremiobacteraeota bacterium]
MQKRKLVVLLALLVTVPLLYYASTIGTVGPAAQSQRLVHSGIGNIDRWRLDAGLQEFRSVAGGQQSLPKEYDRKAHLKASLLTQGKAQDADWLQTCRFEKMDKVEYSWKRVETRATLLTLWDTMVGKNGGVRSLKVRAHSSSPWLQPEILGPLNAVIWPELPETTVAPGDNWESTVSLELAARELAKPLPYQWKFHWNWRPPVPGGSQAVATLDFQAEPTAEAFPLQGNWTGEVLYSVPDQHVVGARGVVKLALTAPTSQPEMWLVEALELNYELLRLLPASKGKTPPGSPPGVPESAASPIPPPQTP